MWTYVCHFNTYLNHSSFHYFIIFIINNVSMHYALPIYKGTFWFEWYWCHAVVLWASVWNWVKSGELFQVVVIEIAEKTCKISLQNIWICRIQDVHTYIWSEQLVLRQDKKIWTEMLKVKWLNQTHKITDGKPLSMRTVGFCRLLITSFIIGIFV